MLTLCTPEDHNKGTFMANVVLGSQRSGYLKHFNTDGVPLQRPGSDDWLARGLGTLDTFNTGGVHGVP